MAKTEFVIHPALTRMPKEPDMWHNRFVRYALMDPSKGRSLLALYNEDRVAQGKPKGNRAPHGWTKAKERWQWERRAGEYDQYNHDQLIQADQAEKTKMFERHKKLAQLVQFKVGQWLQGNANNITSAAEAIRCLEVAIRLERQSVGMPVDMLDVMTMTDQQLIAQYQHVLERMMGDASGEADPEFVAAERTGSRGKRR